MTVLNINFDQFTARNIDKPDSATSKALGRVLVGGVDEFVAGNIADPESLTGQALEELLSQHGGLPGTEIIVADGPPTETARPGDLYIDALTGELYKYS